MPTVDDVDDDEFTDGQFWFWRLPGGQVLPLIVEGEATPSAEHYRRAAALTAPTPGGAR